MIKSHIKTTRNAQRTRPGRTLASRLGSACCLGLALLCLLGLPLQKSRAQASAIGDGGGRGLDASPFWTDPQCGRCHPPQRTASHPVGIVPSFPLPKEFVLTDGRMTCQTCHDLPTANDHAQARLTKTVKLKGHGEPNNFCQNCHTQTDLTPTRALHGSLGGWAHQRNEAGQSRWTRWARSGQNTNRSNQCLSCHDGVLASESRVRMGSKNALQTGLTDHPINISYSQAARDMIRNGADGQLVESTRLDPRLRLFDGEVSCETCHNLYSKEKHLLVFPNRRSQLCISCHEI